MEITQNEQKQFRNINAIEIIDIFLAFSMTAIWIYCMGMTLKFWALDIINFHALPLMSLIFFVVSSISGTHAGGIFVIRLFGMLTIFSFVIVLTHELREISFEDYKKIENTEYVKKHFKSSKEINNLEYKNILLEINHKEVQ